jgi:esterase/lipase superfamily enzyme
MALRSAESPPAAAGDPHVASAPAAAPLPEPNTENDNFHTVKVFYGTDRQAINLTALNWKNHLGQYRNPAITLLVSVIVGCSIFFVRYRKTVIVLTVGSLIATGVLGTIATRGLRQVQQAAAKSDRMYGGERGVLELGTCDVSIPKDHRVGELEAPSILRLEVTENPEKHVVLLNITNQDEDAFYRQLSGKIANSTGKNVFVFIHGYNVKFEDAVRRTAQIAYDLKFDGAPICYSWPSQATLLGYTIDETNVVWTVPHLKKFLLDISERSGATTINLIAHSMGNRALTAALKEVAITETQSTPRFNKVVLAAPDIDAEIFRRDLAPAIISTAKHVTLYASSNDEALIASKRVHGFPRAGESGEGLVIVPGIDTIDVSAIDTSLLGHSYYGSNDSILTDLYHLINDALPASKRQWLQPMFRNGLTYWVFQSRLSGTARHDGPHDHHTLK